MILIVVYVKLLPKNQFVRFLGNSINDNIDKNKWLCKICNYTNNNNNESCPLCNIPKDVRKWTCEDCKFVNESYYFICKICNDDNNLYEYV